MVKYRLAWVPFLTSPSQSIGSRSNSNSFANQVFRIKSSGPKARALLAHGVAVGSEIRREASPARARFMWRVRIRAPKRALAGLGLHFASLPTAAPWASKARAFGPEDSLLNITGFFMLDHRLILDLSHRASSTS